MCLSVSLLSYLLVVVLNFRAIEQSMPTERGGTNKPFVSSRSHLSRNTKESNQAEEYKGPESVGKMKQGGQQITIAFYLKHFLS